MYNSQKIVFKGKFLFLSNWNQTYSTSKVHLNISVNVSKMSFCALHSQIVIDYLDFILDYLEECIYCWCPTLHLVRCFQSLWEQSCVVLVCCCLQLRNRGCVTWIQGKKLQVQAIVKTPTSVRKKKRAGREFVSQEKREGGGTPGLDPSGRV